MSRMGIQRRVSTSAGKLFCDSHAVLPMRPREPNNADNKYDENYGIEFMEILAELAPVLAQLHTEVCQGKAPGPRSQKSVDMKSNPRHARDACRQCNESSNHRQQSSDEYCQVSPAGEETIRPIEFAVAEKNPATVFFYQWTSTVASDFVGHQRSKIAADGSSRRHPQ